MTPLKAILNTISNIKKQGEFISEEELISMLKATKSISKNEDMLNTCISFFKRLDKHNLNKISSLTTRELEVLTYIGNGINSTNIANNLNLSISTIETHRKNIRKKLGLIGKGKLIEYAIINNFTISKHNKS